MPLAVWKVSRRQQPGSSARLVSKPTAGHSRMPSSLPSRAGIEVRLAPVSTMKLTGRDATSPGTR
ncbi:hypothetical protein GCM10007933_43210 [Zoogloea oryzae]|uniref:Uncharacterized protein n=1 Tax=Zoogloea oryzae TaxID=310767 RepID=A0ABQ6FGN9_9RHOO|nr:hypothetical protein GCM10007933_43210 [Zoogloea oryzae]